MEIVNDFVNNQLSLYILPVLLVSVVVGFVYAIGFRRPEQPSFDKLTSDDRKQAGKRKRTKDKKPTANGHVSVGESKLEKSPAKETKRSPVKETSESKPVKERKTENNKLADKNKKNEALKRKAVEEAKNNKKSFKKILSEKPVDFDEGDWEKVPSKADKKKKPDQSPIKKDRKLKKNEAKPVEIEKSVKEEVNKELREKEKEIQEEKSVGVEEEAPIIQEEDEPVIVVIEERKEKKEKKEKKPKKESVEIASLPPPVEEEPLLPTSVVKAEKIAAPVAKKETPNAPAFDALGDVWEEPKTVKKSKKKARRDN